MNEPRNAEKESIERLTHQKLQEELNLRWWQKPAYLSIFVPIILALAGVAGSLITQYFAEERVELNEQLDAARVQSAVSWIQVSKAQTPWSNEAINYLISVFNGAEGEKDKEIALEKARDLDALSACMIYTALRLSDDERGTQELIATLDAYLVHPDHSSVIQAFASSRYVYDGEEIHAPWSGSHRTDLWIALGRLDTLRLQKGLHIVAAAIGIDDGSGWIYPEDQLDIEVFRNTHKPDYDRIAHTAWIVAQREIANIHLGPIAFDRADMSYFELNSALRILRVLDPKLFVYALHEIVNAKAKEVQIGTALRRMRGLNGGVPTVQAMRRGLRPPWLPDLTGADISEWRQICFAESAYLQEHNSPTRANLTFIHMDNPNYYPMDHYVQAWKRWSKNDRTQGIVEEVIRNIMDWHAYPSRFVVPDEPETGSNAPTPRRRSRRDSEIRRE